jgi:hypothetical protein
VYHFYSEMQNSLMITKTKQCKWYSGPTEQTEIWSFNIPDNWKWRAVSILFLFCNNYEEMVTGEGCGHADPPLMTHSVVLFRSSAGNLAISQCTVSAQIRHTKGPRSNYRKCRIVRECTNPVPIRPYKILLCPSFLALVATISYQIRFG